MNWSDIILTLQKPLSVKGGKNHVPNLEMSLLYIVVEKQKIENCKINASVHYIQRRGEGRK